jgi:hypothetical protein
MSELFRITETSPREYWSRQHHGEDVTAWSYGSYGVRLARRRLAARYAVRLATPRVPGDGGPWGDVEMDKRPGGYRSEHN